MEFIPALPILLGYVVGVIIITITPGPDMTFFLSRTVAQGVQAGLAALGGAICGLVIHSTLVAFGLSALIIASPNLFLAVKIGGAGYLLWLAFDAIRNGSALETSRGAAKEKKLKHVWLQGLWINLLNPKIILFFMTFLPQFVSADDPAAPSKLLFLGLVFCLVAIPFTVPMILVADRLTGFLKRSPRVTRAIDYLFATVFGAFAVRILFTERG